MDIKVVDEKGQEAKTDEKKEIVSPNVNVIPDGVLLQNEIASLFDIKPSEVSKYKHKINTLIEYAKYKTDDHSPEGIKWAIRNLGVKLGTPPLGEKLINYLNLYARLHLEGRQLEQRKQEFLKGEQD